MTKQTMERKNGLRAKRKSRVRGKIFGCAERPRLSVFRSNRYIYAQAIDDVNGITLAAVDGSKLGAKANKEMVKEAAVAFAKTLKEKGIQSITFDRNGYLYHGVIASFADALRENGIVF